MMFYDLFFLLTTNQHNNMIKLAGQKSAVIFSNIPMNFGEQREIELCSRF